MWTGMFQNGTDAKWIHLPANVSDLSHTEELAQQNIGDLSGKAWTRTDNISRSFVKLRSNGVMMQVPWEDRGDEEYYPLCKYRGEHF